MEREEYYCYNCGCHYEEDDFDTYENLCYSCASEKIEEQERREAERNKDKNSLQFLCKDCGYLYDGNEYDFASEKCFFCCTGKPSDRNQHIQSSPNQRNSYRENKNYGQKKKKSSFVCFLIFAVIVAMYIHFVR